MATMTTLSELIQEYGASCYVLADAGNGSGFGEDGQIADWDDDSEDAVGAYSLAKLDVPHVSNDGIVCNFASEWMTIGGGDNPYRVRVFF